MGDLVWSKVGTYPWWPCMVSCDPQMKVHTRINTRGRRPNTGRPMDTNTHSRHEGIPRTPSQTTLTHLYNPLRSQMVQHTHTHLLTPPQTTHTPAHPFPPPSPPGHREYHVQFFGSVAERAWIHEKRVVIYQGEQQFDELQAETLRKTSNPAERHKVPARCSHDPLSALGF